MIGGRIGSVLSVLVNGFVYTREKYFKYAQKACEYLRNTQMTVTKFAENFFLTNYDFSKKLTDMKEEGKTIRQEPIVSVSERGVCYTVIVSPDANTAHCSCYRFFDEGIPCQHMLAAYSFVKEPTPCADLMDRMYLKSNFAKAFPCQKCLTFPFRWERNSAASILLSSFRMSIANVVTHRSCVFLPSENGHHLILRDMCHRLVVPGNTRKEIMACLPRNCI